MKIKCNCPCHTDPNIIHIVACCDNGYREITPDEYFKDDKEFATHHKDGSWRFGYPGKINIYTGEGGAKLIMETLQEQLKKYLEDNNIPYKEDDFSDNNKR